jgi:1-acyl-sn-glycerol-3-phosphate acyltransferase
VVAVNHHNALVDGVLLVAHFPRRLVPVAKAPLFSTPLIGWFLRLIGALPVHRRQEGGTDPGRNAALFAASSSALRAGQAILIFPEGVSQPEPTLMPLRTGAARMLLAAETEGTGPVTLLPVGLMLHEPGTFRTGWAVLSMGEPVPTADCVALARTEPEEAARRLTARLGEAMRALIAMVDDRQTLRLVEHAERLWRQERGGEWDATARADWRRRATRAYRYLSHQDPARLSLLRAQMERYVKDLDEAGVRTAVLLKPPAPAVALRYAAGQLAALLGGLPLALWGLLTHALPYWLTWVAARVLRPEGDVEATYKLAAGLALYPLAWIGEAWLGWRLGGGRLLALFLVLLVPSGFFALSWSERLGRLYRETRALLYLLIDRDLARHLAERRREILADMEAAAALVPEPVLSGRVEPTA